jgi:hypothetical protein
LELGFVIAAPDSSMTTIIQIGFAMETLMIGVFGNSIAIMQEDAEHSVGMVIFQMKHRYFSSFRPCAFEN